MAKNKLKDLKPSKSVLLASYIKEELNKLFYVEPDYKKELEMLAYQYAQEEDERMGIHASSITGAGKKFCFRDAVVNALYRQYKLGSGKIPKQIDRAFHYKLDKDKNNPIHLARIFEEGKSVGTKWQRMFIRAGIAVKEDLDVSRFVEEYDLSYTPDAIIELNGKVYVVEIKSSNKNQFEQMKKHPSGQKQLRFYEYFESLNRHVDGGFVLVDCKDNSDFKIFMEMNVSRNDDDIVDEIALLEKIQDYKRKSLKKKKLPPCKCGKCLV